MVFKCIEFVFSMEVPRDDRHQPHSSLLLELSSHDGQSEILKTVFVLICTEFIFGMEVPLDNRHQPHTSLLWYLSYHGNQSENVNNSFF